MRYRIFLSSILLVGTLCASASDGNEPTLSVKPNGRVLMDAATYLPGGDGLNAGAALPEIRAGVKASYGSWGAKIDVGYSFGKFVMKDVYMQYGFNSDNLIRVGYFVHHFGMSSATSSSMKPSMENPLTDTYFASLSRNIGIMHLYSGDKYFSGVSAIIAGTSMTSPSNDQSKASYGGLTRQVWRPLHNDGAVVQMGMSLWYQSALHKKVVNEETGEQIPSPGYFNFKADFPTRVCSTPLLGGNIQDAKSVFKLTPELLLAKGRVAVEGQYYYMNVPRKNGLKSYSASGGYAMFRGILIGGDYTYAAGSAYLATPAPKSFELVAGYNYTGASCRKAGIYGGNTNDYSVTLNYYINKYMLARVRWSYTDVSNSDVQRDRHVNTLQARLQIIF